MLSDVTIPGTLTPSPKGFINLICLLNFCQGFNADCLFLIPWCQQNRNRKVCLSWALIEILLVFKHGSCVCHDALVWIDRLHIIFQVYYQVEESFSQFTLAINIHFRPVSLSLMNQLRRDDFADDRITDSSSKP